ncbi:MAG: T9SS type A sorting domain-containing protein [Bacteroidetes bacterium]|nr:T9SS type A sorting domain-containing protein [Bacteroidota bacterium]
MSEVQQTIWTQTCPPIPGNYHFFLPADQSVSDIYFGNRQCVDPPGGMKAWWPLDEITGSTAKDLMGVDNTGTYVGNPPPTFSSGKVAGSLWFNRPVDWPVPDYIEVQDHDELDFGEGDFSIDAWISPADYPVEFGLDYETIVDKSIDINGKHLGYTLSMYGLNNLVLELGDGTVSQTYFSNPFQFLIDGNHWYHVTVTVDKTVSHEIKFYIDGILKGTSPTSPGSLDNTNVLRIACASDQIANLFYGRLDEIEIFNRILEPDEISDLYNSGIQGKCKDPLYIAANISPIHCNGSTIGTVDIVVTGGLPPYYYEWSNGGSGELIVGLGAGFYTVTVTDNGGKGVSASFEVTEPPALATSGSVGMTSCVGVADGSINLFVTGGVAPYSFIWSNGAVSRNISGLVAGTYTISVSDANGCTTANNFLVGEKPLNPVGVSIVASVNPVCAGNFVTFTATPSNGGNLPSYQWVVNGTNVGTNNATYTYVPADNDEVKCRLVSNATCVSGNPATSNTITMIVNSPTATGSICGFKYSDLNGNGVFDGSDERLAYWTIQLSGDANATAVTDVNGEYCFEHLFMGHYQVSEVSQIRWTQTYPSPRTHDILLSCGQSISNINFGNRPCVKPPDGMTNWWPLDETMGTIAVDKKGFNNVGDYASSPNQPVQIPGMVQGSLKFVNTNQLVEVPDNSEINFGTGDFSIDAWISFSSTSGNVNILDKAQGTRGYSLSIINGVLALTLGDANGFYTYLSTASIPAGPWVHVAVTVDRSATHLVTFYCNGVASNGINLQTNLGSLTNTATLKIGGTTFTSNGAQLDEIETFSRVLSQQEVFDIYNSDSNGKCKTLGNICGFKFEDLDGDGVFDTGEPKLEGWDIHLSGPGIVDIETTTGANGYYCFDQLVSGDYTISEELKGLWVQTYPPPSPDPQNGKHSFNLSEGEGLTDINFGNKRLLPNPYPLPDISNVTCYSGADGTISLTITGGTLPYIYLWNNFQTTSSIHSLSSGTYTVTVTDAGSLTYIGSWTVTEPAAVAVTNVVTNVTCAQASTGMIDISVTGGTPPYFYVWSNGAATQNISGLIAGNYTVTVTDANGCVETTSQAVVVDPLQPVVAPILENFEATSFPPVCWTNTIVSAFYAWARSDTASGNGVGAASAFANFFDQETGAYELKTFPFDISGLASPVLQFNYAYATYVSEIDEMIVYYSPDAGATWHTLLAMPGGISGILNTGGATEESFVPAASQWGTQTLPLPAGTNMLKFKAISSYGNNLYLDNINIMEEPVIPVNNTVQNAVVSGNACYNATNVISVAGGGTVFTVSAGGEAIFIAGQKISFLSGTNVQPEGYLHGFIRPAGPYCGAKAASFTAVPAGEPEIYSVAEKSFFKVYPNPTTGSFSLELTSIEQSAELRVEIYGMHGERVLSAELRGQRKYELSLAGKPVGVYFIRVVIGKFTGTLKIVKH